MSTSEYAFADRAHEQRRLASQAELFVPLTERLFRTAGLGNGMRVPLDTFAFRDAEGVELNVAVAQADAEDEVAPGDDVERRHCLRRVDGIVQVEQQDAETDRHLAGFCSEPRQEWHRLQLLVVALVEIVLA